MNIQSPSPRTIIHGILVTLTVGLLVVEGYLLFNGGLAGVQSAIAQNSPSQFAPQNRLIAQAPAVAEGGAIAGEDEAGGAENPAAPGGAVNAEMQNAVPTNVGMAGVGNETKCVDRMRNFIEGARDPATGKREGGEQKVFSEWINTHFRNKKPTSELLEDAFKRQKAYREKLENEFSNFTVEGKRSASEVVNEDGSCRQYIDENMELVSSLLKNHILENASAKKSVRLLDKYKEINQQLERLNVDVAEMYANFSIFSQKLPCYAQQCVGQ